MKVFCEQTTVPFVKELLNSKSSKELEKLSTKYKLELDSRSLVEQL